MHGRRIVLIDPDEVGRDLLAARLRSLDFVVEVAPDAATGAEIALAHPPAAVIADLWMPGISGVQLCRLLRAEPATCDVPVILRAQQEDPKSRFWTEQAGAASLVSKGRMGDLARVLRTMTERAPAAESFFMHLGGGTLDVRDRIAQHLDAALFESVIAGEVRALGCSGSFAQLFDAFSQLAARLMTYRWMAVSTVAPARMAIHSHPRATTITEADARSVLGVSTSLPIVHVKDEDALEHAEQQYVQLADIVFGPTVLGRLAVALPEAPDDRERHDVVALLGRELGAALRMTTLFEDAQRLATTDALTGLLNRRAFVERMRGELARSDRSGDEVAVFVLDVDHFKSINDRFGHATGDAVLATLGTLLPRQLRSTDTCARWGGEEFVVALPKTNLESARIVAEGLRAAIEGAQLRAAGGMPLPFSVSIGVAVRSSAESCESVLDRADRALYAAKKGGRNRVQVDGHTANPVVLTSADREEAPVSTRSSILRSAA